MRVYIANVVLENEKLPLTQVHHRDIPLRQVTTGIIRQGQQASTLGARDEVNEGSRIQTMILYQNEAKLGQRRPTQRSGENQRQT